MKIQEITEEIAALEACKSYAPKMTAFGANNHAKIDLQIDYLRGNIDPDDDAEWEQYSEDEQSAILEAKNWEEDEGESPSSGWDSFKK